MHSALLAGENVPTPAEKRDVWDQRYRDINQWERYLAGNGIHIVKIMLNVSWREQGKRFLKRIDHPEKNWKFSASDVRERRNWDDYHRAFDEMLTHTSTRQAPWYVVPADHKWFTRLATAAIIVQSLSAINPRVPAGRPGRRRGDGAGQAGTGSLSWLPADARWVPAAPRRLPRT